MSGGGRRSTVDRKCGREGKERLSGMHPDRIGASEYRESIRPFRIKGQVSLSSLSKFCFSVITHHPFLPPRIGTTSLSN